MIKNFEQFKIYFYMYYFYMNNGMESYSQCQDLIPWMKQYLMYKGVSILKYRFNPDTQSNYVIGTEKCHDLDQLVMYFNQYGDI